MLGNYSLSLSIAIVKKVGISVIETGINQVYELVNYLNILKSDYTL